MTREELFVESRRESQRHIGDEITSSLGAQGDAGMQHLQTLADSAVSLEHEGRRGQGSDLVAYGEDVELAVEPRGTHACSLVGEGKDFVYLPVGGIERGFPLLP